jgi:hypothetical protein
MSLIVALLNADFAGSAADTQKDLWSNLVGQSRKMPAGRPSPFRPSARGRVTKLFGSAAKSDARA